MDYHLSTIIGAAIGCAIALVLAIAFAGGIVSAHPRHLYRAKWLCQLAVAITCLYPIIWVRGAQYSDIIIWAVLGSWGAVAGCMIYIIGLWYRSESGHEHLDVSEQQNADEANLEN